MLSALRSALSAPRKCLLCPDQIGATDRSDKEFCSDACRSLNWHRNNRVSIGAYTVEDFEGVRAAISRAERRLLVDAGKKARLIGYSLKRFHPKKELARIGQVEFPDPGRKTKRFPDESGVTHVLRGSYFRWAPFEPPRVPVAGCYIVTLHYEDGSTVGMGEHSVEKGFPSVPFHDKEGNRYDLKGKMIPKRNLTTPKARRKYVPRKQRTPNDSVLPVEATILEHIRVAVARAVQAEREVDRLRGQTPPPPDNTQQAARLDSLSEKVAMLTASLTAAQNQMGQAEARAARAEAQLAQTSETVRSMEAKLRQAALSAASAENALLESGRERGRLSEQLDVLRQAARFPTAGKAVSSVVESPTVASKPAPVQPSSAAVPSSPAPVKPATVPTEQSVTRAAGQAVPPPAAVKPVALRRNTLSILKPGGRI